MKLAKLFLWMTICSFSQSFAQVLVITHSFNRPDFIEIQYNTFKKFLMDDYEFIVFNDAPDEDTNRRIEAICAQHSIRTIRIPQNIHTYAYLYRMPGELFNHPCIRCANVVQYSLNELGLKHNDIVAIVDSDLFLIKKFSIREFMRDRDIAGVIQPRSTGVYYIWNGLVFFDMRTLPNKQLVNFNCGILHNFSGGVMNNTPVDVGGYMFHYFIKTPDVRLKIIYQDYVACHANKSVQELQAEGFTEPLISFVKANPDVVELYAQNAFVHYRAGGNWDKKMHSYHAHKTQILNTFVKALLS